MVYSFKKNSLINLIGKYFSLLISILYTIIMSRLISPSEYGLVITTLVFYTFFSVISSFGLSASIIQNKSLNNTDYRSIFAFTLYISIFISIIFIIISFPISIFFDNSLLINIFIFYSISIFFDTLNIVPHALLLKDLKFLSIAKREIVISLLTCIISIYLAIAGIGIYAIISHAVLGSILNFLVNIKHFYKVFTFKINFSFVKKVVFFSKYQYIFTVINFFSRNIDNFLIATFFGGSQLAFYNRSYELMKFPVSHITSGITPILQPILSNFQSQIDLVLTKYIKVLKVTSIIGTFILVFTFISSNEIILFLFGEQWVESTQSLKFLSLSIWAQMLTSTAGPIFQSLNRVKELFIIGLINSITLMFFIFIGVSLGDINNLAFLVSMGYIIVFFQVFFILFKKVFNLNFVFVINILKQDFFNLFLIFIFMNVLSDLLFIENLTLNLLFKFFSLLLAQFITLIITKQLKYLDFIIVDIKNVIKLIRSHSI